MDKNLNLIDLGKGKIRAIMTVMDDDGEPINGKKKKLLVDFKINHIDDTDAPSLIDSEGSVEREISASVGKPVDITAFVLGHPTLTITKTITPKAKAKKPCGPVEQTIMVVYWIAFFLIGVPFGLGRITAAYLIAAMLVLAGIAKLRGITFREAVLKENNWVFLSVLAMTLISGFMSYFNPYTPFGLLGSLGAHTDSNWFFKLTNRLFFDRLRTRGWTYMTGYCFLWLLPAGILSFRDEVMDLLREKTGGKTVKEFVKHGKWEAFFALLELPIKAALRFFGLIRK